MNSSPNSFADVIVVANETSRILKLANTFFSSFLVVVGVDVSDCLCNYNNRSAKLTSDNISRLTSLQFML